MHCINIGHWESHVAFRAPTRSCVARSGPEALRPGDALYTQRGLASGSGRAPAAGSARPRCGRRRSDLADLRGGDSPHKSNGSPATVQADDVKMAELECDAQEAVESRSGIMQQLPDINRHFAAPTVEAIRESLEASGNEWARAALGALDMCALPAPVLGARKHPGIAWHAALLST